MPGLRRCQHTIIGCNEASRFEGGLGCDTLNGNGGNDELISGPCFFLGTLFVQLDRAKGGLGWL